MGTDWSIHQLFVVLERARDAGIANGPSLDELSAALRSISLPHTTASHKGLTNLCDRFGGIDKVVLVSILDALGLRSGPVDCDQLARTMIGEAFLMPTLDLVEP